MFKINIPPHFNQTLLILTLLFALSPQAWSDNADYPEPAGTLQFSGHFFEAKPKQLRFVVFVTRSGGSYGEISVEYQVTDNLESHSGSLIWSHRDTTPKSLVIDYNRSTPLSLLLFNVSGGAILGTPYEAFLTVVGSTLKHVILGMPDNNLVWVPIDDFPDHPLVEVAHFRVDNGSLNYPSAYLSNGKLEIPVVAVLENLYSATLTLKIGTNPMIFDLSDASLLTSSSFNNHVTYEPSSGLVHLPKLSDSGSCYKTHMMLIPGSNPLQFQMAEKKPLSVSCF